VGKGETMNVYLAKDSDEAARNAADTRETAVYAWRAYRTYWVAEAYVDGKMRCQYAGRRRMREAIELAREYLQQG
jgi:cobalamin biosynthesis Mg chelatase CobN